MLLSRCRHRCVYLVRCMRVWRWVTASRCYGSGSREFGWRWQCSCISRAWACVRTCAAPRTAVSTRDSLTAGHPGRAVYDSLHRERTPTIACSKGGPPGEAAAVSLGCCARLRCTRSCRVREDQSARASTSTERACIASRTPAASWAQDPLVTREGASCAPAAIR